MLSVLIRSALRDVHGWRYPAADRRTGVPWRPAGVPSQVPTGTGAIDCSTLTAFVVLAAVGERLAPADARQLYRDLQVWDGTRPYSPVEALTALGLATEGERRDDCAALSPWGWTLVQSWRGAEGHARLVEAVEGGWLVHESSRSRGGVVTSTIAEPWTPAAWGRSRTAWLTGS